MEIIDELELCKRSVYCGSIGYISANGLMDTNIAIRTILSDGNKIHCWGGGGIVADSDAEDEYQEILDKVGLLIKF
jgi:para-aminobenzoate synthetase component 1